MRKRREEREREREREGGGGGVRGGRRGRGWMGGGFNRF